RLRFPRRRQRGRRPRLRAPGLPAVRLERRFPLRRRRRNDSQESFPYLMGSIKPIRPVDRGVVRDSSPIVLKDIYEHRFDAADHACKEAIWRELGRFLQRYVPRDGRVIDIACDLGYFIRIVSDRERWAPDIRDVGAPLPPDVHFIRASGLDLADVLPN